jgi:hypothetical protein
VQGSTTSRPGGDLDREAKLPLIAVIAVHGVADQAPNESARQISELLLRQRYEDGAETYTSFREYPLRIPVDPPLPPCGEECHVGEPEATGITRSQSDPDLDFTHRLLHHYESRRTPYDTVRLEGHRLRPAKKAAEESDWIARDQCHVHVYELFWADLSRLGTGLIGIVGAIYQLISSLSQLGLRTIKQSRRHHDPEGKAARWTAYLRAHRFAVWLLTVVVPLLNLCILGAALAMLVARAPRTTRAAVFAMVLVLGVLAARTIWRLRGRRPLTDTEKVARGPNDPRDSKPLRGPSALWLIVVALAGAGLYWSLTRLANDSLSMKLILALWTVVQTAALIKLGQIFDDRIRTAFRVAVVLSLWTAALLLVVASTSNDVVQVAHGTIRTIELLFWILTASWVLLTISGIVSAIGALRIVRLKTPGIDKDLQSANLLRARRALWTGASTLAVSTASLSALTLFVWSALYAVLSVSLPAPKPEVVTSTSAMVWDSSQAPTVRRLVTQDTSYGYRPVITHQLLAINRAKICFDSTTATAASRVIPCGLLSFKSILRTLLSVSAMAGLLVNGFALFLAAAIGLWLALPSVLQEVRPRTDPKAHPGRSEALGEWLTQGFDQLRKVVVGAYALIFGATFAVIVLAFWLFLAKEQTPGVVISLFEFLQPRSDAFLFGIGSLVAASTVGVVALLTRFESWSKVVRPGLDVALDVDNYLKSRPENRTPRARMMERFVALLRYVTRWRRDGAGYDAIIVIAHSQGTVLTSEVLRYQTLRKFANLSLEEGYPLPDAQAKPKPTSLSVDFLTMGSPLRQLYTSSFPDLFAWTFLSRPSDGTTAGRAFCNTLGVRRWWNVFRSGDYVGRALWQYGGKRDAFEPGKWFGQDDSCREMCLGPGAHTHYWNENGSDVGQVLDDMICAAYENSPRREAR